VGKNKVHHFQPPLKNIWKNPQVAPPRKILPTPMLVALVIYVHCSDTLYNNE